MKTNPYRMPTYARIGLVLMVIFLVSPILVLACEFATPSEPAISAEVIAVPATSTPVDPVTPVDLVTIDVTVVDTNPQPDWTWERCVEVAIEQLSKDDNNYDEFFNNEIARLVVNIDQMEENHTRNFSASLHSEVAVEENLDKLVELYNSSFCKNFTIDYRLRCEENIVDHIMVDISIVGSRADVTHLGQLAYVAFGGVVYESSYGWGTGKTGWIPDGTIVRINGSSTLDTMGNVLPSPIYRDPSSIPTLLPLEELVEEDAAGRMLHTCEETPRENGDIGWINYLPQQEVGGNAPILVPFSIEVFD